MQFLQIIFDQQNAALVSMRDAFKMLNLDLLLVNAKARQVLMWNILIIDRFSICPMNILWEHQQTGLQSPKMMLLVPEWYIGTERTPPLLQATVTISKLYGPFLWGRRVQRLCTGLQTFQQSLLRGNFWLHVLVHHTKKNCMGYL